MPRKKKSKQPARPSGEESSEAAAAAAAPAVSPPPAAPPPAAAQPRPQSAAPPSAAPPPQRTQGFQQNVGVPSGAYVPPSAVAGSSYPPAVEFGRLPQQYYYQYAQSSAAPFAQIPGAPYVPQRSLPYRGPGVNYEQQQQQLYQPQHYVAQQQSYAVQPQYHPPQQQPQQLPYEQRQQQQQQQQQQQLLQQQVLAAEEKLGALRVQPQQQAQPMPSSQTQIVPSFSLAAGKDLKFPTRPGTGTKGNKCWVTANHFLTSLPDKDLHQYDVKIVPDIASRGVNRAVMNQLIRIHKNSSLGSRLPAYDGRKSLYTAGALPFTQKEFEIVLVDEDDGPNAPRRERRFNVVIKFAARASLHHLGEFLKGKQRDAPQEALQVLDIVLRQLPTQRYSPVGRSFYSPELGTPTLLGNGLESWRGFYQSIRPTQMGLSLNIDMSSTAFIEAIPVVDFVKKLLSPQTVGRHNDHHSDLNDLSRPLSDADRHKIKKALKGVKVEVTHRGPMRRKYRISGLTYKPTQELTFSVDNVGTIKTVVDYFRETYGYTIRSPSLPCLQVGNQQRPNYLPMEVCKIVEGQRYSKRLNEKQIGELLKVTCQRPMERQRDILKTVQRNTYSSDPHAQEFGIRIDEALVSVQARILPAPRLKYHETGRDKVCVPHVGQWNMMNKKMFSGGRVNYWACINFCHQCPDHVVAHFCTKLANMCQTSGMVFNIEPIMPVQRASPDKVESALKSLCLDVRTIAKGKELDLLVAILPDNNGTLYGHLKRICETELGIVSQCCLTKHVYNGAPQYLANVALKINVKVGGRNTVLVDAISRTLPLVSDKPTIIFGADVTHPHPGEDSSPSIAAVVASQDWPEITKYAGLVCAQAHRQELIAELYTKTVDPQTNTVRHGGMIRELLSAFYRATNRKPERILFYRDGVSEGQFYQVLLNELDDIRKACASLEANYLPPVTFVVVQKRHHTRLFAQDNKQTDSKSGNILPGTVVDTKICHPTEFDFYLCSHAGIQGTSRPAHYHVLWDENKFSADGLQELTNNLCYTYARCTRSVSIVPPAYYAHLAAFRARFYMEPEPLDSGGSGDGGGGGGSGGSGGGRGGPKAPVVVRPLPRVKDNVRGGMFYC